jgi:DNA-binding response OmpR family regulator
MALPPRILIVDDDHDIHGFIAELLAMSGYEADCVHHTDDARMVIRRAPPAFLVLDLHIDRPYAGWTLLQELRADPATATIPAVLVTSDDDFVRAHKSEVRAAGATVLDKPFDPDVMVKLVEMTLGPAQA